MSNIKKMPLIMAIMLIMSVFASAPLLMSSATAAEIVESYDIGEKIAFEKAATITGVYDKVDGTKIGEYKKDVAAGEEWDTSNLKPGYYHAVQKVGFIQRLFGGASETWIRLGGVPGAAAPAYGDEPSFYGVREGAPIGVANVRVEGVTNAMEGMDEFALGDKVMVTGSVEGISDGTPIRFLLKGTYLSEISDTQLGVAPARVEGGRFAFTIDTSVRVDLLRSNLYPDVYTMIVYADQGSRGYQKSDPSDIVTLNLKMPTVTFELESNTVTTIGEIRISGEATGNPDSVMVWLVNESAKTSAVVKVPVKDNLFEAELTAKDFTPWFSDKGLIDPKDKFTPATDYVIMVVHPGVNGYAYPSSAAAPEYLSGSLVTNGRLIASDYTKFISSVKDDDIVATQPLNIELPYMELDIPNVIAGENIVINGTTNLANGTVVLVEVPAMGLMNNTKVENGQFKVVFPDANIPAPIKERGLAGTYSASARDIDNIAYAQAEFDIILEKPVVEKPAEKPVAEAPVEEPAEEETPGFGILVAIAGLLAVAYLVVRKR